MRVCGLRLLSYFIAVAGTLALPGLAASQNSADASPPHAPRFLIPSADSLLPPVAIDPARLSVLRRRISVSFDGVTRRRALAELARLSGLEFVYSDDLLSSEDTVHLQAANITVAAALTDVLLDANVDVLIKPGGNAVLVKRAFAPVAAEAPQAQQAGVIIRGRVTRPDSTPFAGVTIVATPTGDSSKATHTDSAGAYSITFDRTVARYALTVSFVGYQLQRRDVSPPAGGGTIVADFRMTPTAQTLTPVRTVVERLKPPRDETGLTPTPGTNQARLDLSSGLSGDLTGDLTAALAMLPGISLIPDGNGGFTASAFGLGADQNGVTLNGMDYGGSTTPRDGMAPTAVLSTYDPKVGRFAGAQVQYTLRSGSNTDARTLHATLDDPALQWTTPVARGLGTESQYGILSGTASGSLVPHQIYYSTAYDIRRRVQDLTTLTSGSPASEQALGISADSVARLLAIAGPLGLPVVPPGAPSARLFTRAGALGRIDFTPGFATPGLGTYPTTFYLLGGGGWWNSSGLGGGPTALPSRLGESTHHEGNLMSEYSAYIWGNALNDTKTSFSIRDDRSAPYLNLPAATILLNSVFANGSAGFGTLQAGGGSTESHSRQWTWETSNDATWYSLNQHHRFEVYTDAELNHFEQSQLANGLGTFSYNSLAALAAGQPSAFTRNLSALSSAGQSWLGALGLSDVFRPDGGSRQAEGFAFQYGVRTDLAAFGEHPAFNPVVDSLFGLRTNRVPNSITVEPMAGFTWIGTPYRERLGSGIYATPANTITGGFREYRTPLTPQGVDAVARQSGLAGAALDLQCVGAAIPAPDWSAYAKSQASVPSTCADGTLGSPLAQTAAPVLFYAPGFAPQTWRGALQWVHLINPQLNASLGATYAVSVVPSVFDLNFNPVTRFTLDDEGSRPVFVTPASIVPTSGAVASTESRIAPAFTHVTELRSDLRSSQGAFTTGLTWYVGRNALFAAAQGSTPPRVNATLTATYSYADSRSETNGFGATAAGDPRATVWGTSPIPRHTIRTIFNLQVDRLVSISMSGALTSGYQYTPLVGSDINGDGYANDRAFVFNPATAADPTVAAGMGNLLTTAPRGARDCLRAQLGTIAGQYSCEAPWSAQLPAITARFDSYRLGLGNRGALVVVVNNALGGLDQLLHGENHLQGWGQAAIASPTLLNVRGFDPVANRFLYTVNPLFGSVSANRTAYRPPFKVTIDFLMDVGPDRETQAIKRVLAPTTGRTPPPTDEAGLRDLLLREQARLTGGTLREELFSIVRDADSLHLSGAQVAAITSLRHRLDALHDSIYSDLARYLAPRHGDYDGEEVRTRWHQAVAASERARYVLGSEVRELLTADQYAWLKQRQLTIDMEYSPDWLERMLRGPQLVVR